MSQRDDAVVHVPPRPGHATIFFIVSGGVFFAAVFVLISTGPDNPLFIPARVLLGLGALPGLFAWHIFGSRSYRAVRGDDRPPLAPVPTGARYALLSGQDLPFSAIVDAGRGRGVEGTTGHLLCLRYAEVARWTHPMALLQYGATAASIWQATATASYTACLVMPAAWIGMLIYWGWLLLGGPWCVIDMEVNGCWFDDTCAGFGRGLQRRRVVAAAPDEQGLRLTFEGDRTMTIGFPHGSLAPREQERIALELFRQHGIPTTAEDRPIPGAPYR